MRNVPDAEALGSPALAPPRVGSGPHPDQGPRPLSHTGDYVALKRLIQQHGLLERQPVYYGYKILLTLGLLLPSLILLSVADNLWLQLINAAYLAFVFAQIVLLGHDAGHGQIAAAAWKNDIISLLLGNLLVGISAGWWVEKHNQHHSYPNQLGRDPDVAILCLAFTAEQALSKHGLRRSIVKYQAYLFSFLLLLEAFSLRVGSLRFLLRKKARHRRIEMLLLALHALTYVGLLFFLLPFWHAVLFMLVHQALLGLYLGSVFAPNHKGMPILDGEEQLDFLNRQLLTTRNIRAQPFVDFWCGGLNYQIEHHLFPTMPRNRFKSAQELVKQFCSAHSIAYHEAGVLQSFREILRFLHQVSAPLREAES